MKLSPHFTLEELTDSQTAARDGIDNTPSLEVVANLERLALKVLEPVRVVLNANPIQVTSGYRSEALEKVICKGAYEAWCKLRGLPVSAVSWARYFETKNHPRGEAADIKSPSFGSPEKVMAAIYNSNIEYDQLILEFDQWVHISYSDRNRKQALVIDKKGTRNYAK